MEPGRRPPGPLVHVQGTVELDHHGLHPGVLPVHDSGHDRSLKRPVFRDTPPLGEKCIPHRGEEARVRVKWIRPDADIRSVRGRVLFMGQWCGGETVTVDDERGSVHRTLVHRGFRQPRVMRVVI